MSDAETLRAAAPELHTVWNVSSIEQSQSSRNLLFESRQQLFAVAVDHVVEVIKAPVCNPVPESPWWFLGLAAYRSRPAPMIDPVQFFVPTTKKSGSTYRPADQNTYERAIVVTLASSTYLFCAEKILNLCHLDAPYSNHDEQDLAAHSAVSGIYQYDNRSVAVIDIPEFLRDTKLLRGCG